MQFIRNIFLKRNIPKPQLDKNKTSQRSVSKSVEWVAFGEEDPLCWAPWRVLKVDIFDQTLSCCGFFEKLPVFEWPTAKEFHSQQGMWNHPVMQQLRGSLGTEDELPFCTFCKNSDKRHPDKFEDKISASAKSKDIFQAVYDQSADFEFKGALGEIRGDLTEYQCRLPTRNNAIFKPFKGSLLQYRRFVRTRGFRNIGSVLQLGVGAGSYSPFLAETNKSLTIVDFHKGRIKNVSAILQNLNFDNFNSLSIDELADLERSGQKFDGIWLDGEWFSQCGRTNLLKTICKLLNPNAIVQVVGARGAGHLVKKAVKTDSNKKFEQLVNIIEKGPSYDGLNSFVTAEGLLKILRPFGLVLDRTRPALSRYIGSNQGRNRLEWNDFSKLSQLLKDRNFRAAVRSNPSELDGLVERVSFTMSMKIVDKLNIETVPIELISKQ